MPRNLIAGFLLFVILRQCTQVLATLLKLLQALLIYSLNFDPNVSVYDLNYHLLKGIWFQFRYKNGPKKAQNLSIYSVV